MGAALVVALAAGCAQTGRRSAPVRGGAPVGYDEPWSHTSASAGERPDWASMPHSWARLTAIEKWLESIDQRSLPGGPKKGDAAYWYVEATLQLAEGKLSFAGPGEVASNRVLSYRRDSARDGFEFVMSDRRSSKQQVTRAKRGLLSIDDDPAAEPASRPVPASSPPPVQGLVRRSRWSAQAPNRRKLTPASSRWRWITVHHSVFRPGSDKLASSLECVQRIQRNHIQVNGWADIGYHYLIDRAGRVIEGRELVWQGAHAGGTNNRGNVGICLLGNFEEEHPTGRQLASLDRLVYQLQSKLKIPRANVRPHRAWGSTDCPGRHLMPWFARP